MALTDQEKRNEWAKREFALKDGLVAAEVAEKRREAQKYREVVRAEREQERLENAKDIDGKLYWDKVKEEAHRMVSDGVAGYNNWDTGMTNLVSRCMALANATWYDPIFPFREHVLGFKNIAVDFVWDQTIGRVSDWIDKKRFKDSDLPRINVNVALDQDGGLLVEVSKDKKISTDPAFLALKRHIDEGVVAWALTQGYELRQDRLTNKWCFFDDTTTESIKMTLGRFDELNTLHPEQGLERFLSGRFQLPVTMSLTP